MVRLALLITLVSLTALPLLLAPYPFLAEESLTFDLNPYMAAATFDNWWGLVQRPHYTDYTPVGWTLQFLVVTTAGADNIVAIRLVSVLLQLGVVLLGWRLLGLWMPQSPRLAWTIAAVYAVHPMSLEQMVWTPAQKWLLSVNLALLAMIIWWGARRDGDGSVDGGASRMRPGRVVLAGCVFLLALLSKGGVIVVPPLLFVADCMIGRQSLRRAAWRTAPMFAIAIGFGLFASQLHANTSNVAYIGGSPVVSVVSHLPALLRAIGHWMLPITSTATGLQSPLAFYYHVDVANSPERVAQAIGAGVLALAILGGAWLAAGRTRLATLAALWFLGCQAIVLGLFPHQWWHLADRYSCLGGFGLLLLFALALSRPLMKLPAEPRRFFARAALFALLVAGLTASSYARRMWQDPQQFARHNIVSQGTRHGTIALQSLVAQQAPQMFYSAFARCPLDRPLSSLQVPDAQFVVMQQTPLHYAIGVREALLMVVQEPGADELLYTEAYADDLLMLALQGVWAPPPQTAPMVGLPDGETFAERLLAHAARYESNPRIALRVAVYFACRDQFAQATPWLDRWRESERTQWPQLLAAAAEVTADSDPPDATWFVKADADYVDRVALRSEYFVFLDLATREALATGDTAAARRVLQVARMLYPGSATWRARLAALTRTAD